MVNRNGMKISEERKAQLFAEVQQNQKTLESCKQHNFSDIPEPRKLHLLASFKCANCGGKMRKIDAFNYTLGFEAAGGDPNKIIRNFR